jgi:hypothetical protein
MITVKLPLPLLLLLLLPTSGYKHARSCSV